MKDALYIITGISRLSGEREAISLPTSKQQALARLETYRSKRRHREAAAFTRLKVERLQPIQLTLNFTE